MRAILLTLLLGFTFTGFSQVVLENFEDGASLPWNAANGSFEVVANVEGQDTLMINPSDSVGQYTKEEGAAYSLLIAELDNPLDLSTDNQFRIMVNAPVATAFILKLEGDGEAIEKTKNIAVANQWVEYTFNFSEASDMTTLNKIILFFDPGVAESSDTYLFDNLVAEPAGVCDGVAEDPTILDDFECQRNVQYGLPGLTDIEAVDNPDPSGINTSLRVGQYTDREGAFHALVIPFNQDLPLDQRSVVKIKVWAPVTGRLLVKLEGGDSGAIEKDVQVETTMEWVEYSIDFSDQAGASHRQLVFFFNAGEADADGDIYYIDDIQLVEKEVVSNIIEDFEDGPALTWTSLGDEAIFGTFDGAIDNPDPTEPNTSATVGSYTKGTSALGGLEGILPGDFDISIAPQLNIQVWAPADANSLTMQLSSPAQGLKEVTREFDTNQEWIDLNFDFSEFADITDFESVRLLFDTDLESQDTWYFDNLAQGESTGDACEGVEVMPYVIDDFDCQRNATIVNGGDQLQVITNPDASGINDNAADMVGEYTDPNDEFSALVYEFDNLDLSVYNQLSLKVWSPEAVPLGFKLQGGTTASEDILTDVTTTGEWVEYVLDFSDYVGTDNNQLAIFFNFGVAAGEELVYYVDDIEWTRPVITGCIVNFEEDAFTIPEWQYFANGDLDGDVVNVVVENPDKSGINTSDFVGEFLEMPGGENFAGMFTTNSDFEFTLPNDDKTVSMKVWMDNPGRVALKLERSNNDAPNTGDVFAEYTEEGAWQELTWDYSGIVPDGGVYTLLSLIMDFDETPDSEKVYYFDDIAIADSDCAMTTSRDRVELERLRVSPNPAYRTLVIQNAEGLERFVIYNLLGQPVQTIRTTGQYGMEVDLADFGRGIYILNGYDRNGTLRATTKFVKH